VMPSLACDTHGSGGDGAPMDGSDGGTSGGAPGDGNVCTIEPTPQGPALLDHANCIHQDTGIVLASCSSTNNLFRGCDAAFLDWCNAQGGDASVRPGGESIASLEAAACGTGEIAPACDVAFFEACDTIGGVMTCDDEACCVGVCEPPPQFICVDVTWSCTSEDGKQHHGTCKKVNTVGKAIRCALAIQNRCGRQGTVVVSYSPC